MPYQNLPIMRSNPSALVFLLDQSLSMQDPFGGDPSLPNKAHGLADAINRLLQTLVIRCTRDIGVMDYFDVAVIGYSTDPNGTPIVQSALGGPLAGRDLVKVTDLSDNPFRVEDREAFESDGAGGIIKVQKKFPVWVEPVTQHGTPMNAALERAYQILEGWIAAHPDNFPPIVIHITDGESSDGDPTAAAQRVMNLATSDGNILLFNCHLSQQQAGFLLFPDSEAQVPTSDPFALQLYNMSSELPPFVVKEAQAEGFAVSDTSRGFAFNADIIKLIQFLDIGTRVSNNLR